MCSAIGSLEDTVNAGNPEPVTDCRMLLDADERHNRDPPPRWQLGPALAGVHGREQLRADAGNEEIVLTHTPSGAAHASPAIADFHFATGTGVLVADEFVVVVGATVVVVVSATVVVVSATVVVVDVVVVLRAAFEPLPALEPLDDEFPGRVGRGLDALRGSVFDVKPSLKSLKSSKSSNESNVLMVMSSSPIASSSSYG